MDKKSKSQKTVRVTEKNLKDTRVEKNKNLNRSVNKNITDELNKKISSKKTVITALVFALLLGIFAYLQVDKSIEDKNYSNDTNDLFIEEDKDDTGTILEYEEDVEDNYAIKTSVNITPKTEDKEDENIIIEEYFALSFDSNGGTEIENQVLTTNDTTVFVQPTKENWSFAGWYKDENFTEPFIFGGHIDSDTTVYAKWSKFIKYVYDNNQVGDLVEVGENEEIPLLSSEDLDENFAWAHMYKYIDEEGNIRSFEVLPGTILSESNIDLSTDTITLYLEKLEKFELEFYLDEVSEVYHSQEVVENREVSFEEVNDKIAFEHPEIDLETIGWYYYDEDGNKVDFAINKPINKEITKLYLGGTYTIIYTEEIDEELVEIDKQKVAKDSKVEMILIPEEKDDLEFDGWYIIENSVETNIKLEAGRVIDKDLTVIGRWNELGSIDEIQNEEQSVEQNPEETAEEDIDSIDDINIEDELEN